VADVCSVCDEAAGDDELSVCNSCGEPFHLNQRNDRPGKDCGVVWINEQFPALEFACQRCLDGGGAQQPAERPRILRPDSPGRGPRRYRKRA